MFCQNSWGDLIHLADKLEHWVIGQMTESKLALRDIAGVGFAENGVPVTGYDLSRFQSRPKVVCNGLVAEIAAYLTLHFLQPVEDFLVGSVSTVSGGDL